MSDLFLSIRFQHVPPWEAGAKAEAEPRNAAKIASFMVDIQRNCCTASIDLDEANDNVGTVELQKCKDLQVGSVCLRRDRAPNTG